MPLQSPFAAFSPAAAENQQKFFIASPFLTAGRRKKRASSHFLLSSAKTFHKGTKKARSVMKPDFGAFFSPAQPESSHRRHAPRQTIPLRDDRLRQQRGRIEPSPTEHK
jgi:transposase